MECTILILDDTSIWSASCMAPTCGFLVYGVTLTMDLACGILDGS